MKIGGANIDYNIVNIMKLTKDESAILEVAIEKIKYDLFDQISHKYTDRSEAIKAFEAFEDLQKRLYQFSIDKRRNGRKSRNTFFDILLRFVNNIQKH